MTYTDVIEKVMLNDTEVFSGDDLLKYRDLIVGMLDGCKRHFSFYSLNLVIILAYEYCLYYAYFDADSTATITDSQKITQNYVYAYLRKQLPSYDFHHAWESFTHVRDLLFHLNSEQLTHTEVKALLQMDDFIELIYQFNFPLEALESLRVIAAKAEHDNNSKKILTQDNEQPRKIGV